MNIDKDNSGIVFFNDSDNENAPELSGQIKVDGVQYRIAMWRNEGKKGSEFYGVMLQEVDGEEAPRRSGGGNGGRSARNASSSRGSGQRRGKPSRR